MTRPGRSRNRHAGCGTLASAVLITCLMLVANRLLARALYELSVPARFEFERLRTVIEFLLMIGLLFPEWWLLDRLTKVVRNWLRSKDSE